MLACNSDGYLPVSFKLGVITENTELFIWYQFGWLTNIEGHKTCTLIFLQISDLVLIKFSMLLQPLILFKLLRSLFCAMNIQWRELFLHDFIEIKIHFQHWPASSCLWTDLFQTCYDAVHNWTLHHISSLNDHDLHSMLQGYRKDGTCAIILL